MRPVSATTSRTHLHLRIDLPLIRQSYPSVARAENSLDNEKKPQVILAVTTPGIKCPVHHGVDVTSDADFAALRRILPRPSRLERQTGRHLPAKSEVPGSCIAFGD